MANDAKDWMVAAACVEGPRPKVTFGDLPRQHQEDILRLAVVAVASTAYFITLVVLSAPLASRSLVAHATLPHPGVARSPVLEARVARVEPVSTPRRVLRPRPDATLAVLREPASVSLAARSTPRRNPFSRFFRGILHTVVTPN